MHSLKDETAFFFSGRGMPYEKVSLTVAVIASIVFSLIFSNNYIKDAAVVVIDLDNSKYSREFINTMDASPYIRVRSVINVPAEPKTLFYRDKCIAVVYLPDGFEKSRYSHAVGNIGVFYDNTNSAQSANLKEALNELIAFENQKEVTELQNLSGAPSADSGLLLHDRKLFNPVGSYSNGETLGFLLFFSTMFFVFATIGIVPRLRLEQKWTQELATQNPFSFILRLLPYACCLIVAIVIGLAILRTVGDLIIAGNFLLFLAALVFLAISTGMMSLLFGWNAANPGAAASRMILFIPGGFVLGGMTGPIPIVPDWVQMISNVFPLVWIYRFTRDILLRGASFMDCAPEFGGFMIYTALLIGLVCLKFYRARRLTLEKNALSEEGSPQ